MPTSNCSVKGCIEQAMHPDKDGSTKRLDAELAARVINLILRFRRVEHSIGVEVLTVCPGLYAGAVASYTREVRKF